MKIDRIVKYCDENVTDYASEKACDDCNHCSEYPGNCGACLDQVHLTRKSDERQLMNLPHIHMLSIGSGPSPDLYALWKFKKDMHYSKPISYIGFEHNRYWEDINEETKDIFSNTGIEIEYYYEDAMESFKTKNLKRSNVLVLQYLLSHIVYNERGGEKEGFFRNLIENVVMYMEDKAFIIFNDINHCLARDNFVLLEEMLEDYGKRIRVHKYYYPYNGIKDVQRDGKPHTDNGLDWDYNIDDEFIDYYNTRITCRSIQHIIEVF